MTDVPSTLRDAAQIIEDQEAADLPLECFMIRSVNAFNALTGLSLSEAQGWLFVSIFKLAKMLDAETNTK